MGLLYLKEETAAPSSLPTAAVTRTQPQREHGPVPAVGLLVSTPGQWDMSSHQVKLQNSEPVLGSASPFLPQRGGITMQLTLREKISKSPILWAGLLDAIPGDFIYTYIFFKQPISSQIIQSENLAPVVPGSQQRGAGRCSLVAAAILAWHL